MSMLRSKRQSRRAKDYMLQYSQELGFHQTVGDYIIF